MRHMHYDGPGCPVEACTGVITGKWKGEILHWLLEGPKRLGDLNRLIPTASRQELASQLQELQTSGVVSCHITEGMPRRVEYSLTDTGKTLKPVIKAAWQWGRSFLNLQPAASHDAPTITPDASPII